MHFSCQNSINNFTRHQKIGNIFTVVLKITFKIWHVEFFTDVRSGEKRLNKKFHTKCWEKQDPASAFIVIYKLANGSSNVGVRMCTDISVLNGFPLTNFFLLIPLGKCPFSNICQGCTYETSQIYLRRYFLNTFLK